MRYELNPMGLTPEELHQALAELNIPGFQGVITSGEDADAIFDSEITQAQIDQLDDAIANYKAAGRSMADAFPRIFSYIRRLNDRDFRDVNYKNGLTTRLHPRHTFERGVIVRTGYFAYMSFNPATYQFDFSEEVVREDYVYQRDANGFAQSRVMSITWFNNDGTVNEATKNRVKIYTTAESIRETARRRQNILDQLQVDLMGIFMQALGDTQRDAVRRGQQFWKGHSNGIALFKDIGDEETLISEIANDTENTWLTADIGGLTIRDFINSKLMEVQPE